MGHETEEEEEGNKVRSNLGDKRKEKTNMKPKGEVEGRKKEGERKDKRSI